MAVQTQFQFRRGTASQWTSANPTLAAGELGFETDTGKAKIGDGSTAWTSRAYAITGEVGDITGVTAGTGLSGGGNSGGVTISIDTTTTADLTTSQTLTNKTLTSPSITSPTITGTSKIQQIVEKVTVSATAANTTVNYDLITNGGILYYTSDATANWTLNVRGDNSTSLNSIMSTGQSVTIAFLVTNGATAYYQSAFQVDGSAVTPKWQGGTAASAGNTSSVDIYTITVIKTADATFTALAALTKFA